MWLQQKNCQGQYKPKQKKANSENGGLFLDWIRLHLNKKG